MPLWLLQPSGKRLCLRPRRRKTLSVKDFRPPARPHRPACGSDAGENRGAHQRGTAQNDQRRHPRAGAAGPCRAGRAFQRAKGRVRQRPDAQSHGARGVSTRRFRTHPAKNRHGAPPTLGPRFRPHPESGAHGGGFGWQCGHQD